MRSLQVLPFLTVTEGFVLVGMRLKREVRRPTVLAVRGKNSCPYFNGVSVENFGNVAVRYFCQEWPWSDHDGQSCARPGGWPGTGICNQMLKNIVIC